MQLSCSTRDSPTVHQHIYGNDTIYIKVFFFFNIRVSLFLIYETLHMSTLLLSM